MKVFIKNIEEKEPTVYFNSAGDEYVPAILNLDNITYDNIFDMKEDLSDHIEDVAEEMRNKKCHDTEEIIVMNANLSETNSKHLIIEVDSAVGVEIETPSEEEVNHIVYLDESINMEQGHGLTSKNFRLEDFVTIRDTIKNEENWERK